MTTQPLPVTRREFLYYVWAASIACFTAETTGALLWFALPRAHANKFGGPFTIPPEEIPLPDSLPARYTAGRFWLVNIGTERATDPRHPQNAVTQPGLAAFFALCTHEHCDYKWVPINNRFECPCHGAKFLLDGTRVDGPAQRDLDRFQIRALDADGGLLAATKLGNDHDDSTVGQPLALPEGTAAIVIDTGKLIRGHPRSG